MRFWLWAVAGVLVGVLLVALFAAFAPGPSPPHVTYIYLN